MWPFKRRKRVCDVKFIAIMGVVVVLLLGSAIWVYWRQNYKIETSVVGQEIFEKFCKAEKNQYGAVKWVCESPIADLKCEIFSMSAGRSGLSPRYPIVPCRHGKIAGSLDKGVYQEEFMGMNGGGYNEVYYIVYKNNKFILINSPEQFRSIFAPVETEEEALAFVVKFDKGYIIEDEKSYQAFEDYWDFQADRGKFKATSVKKVNGGFLVENAYSVASSCGADAVWNKTFW
jgi:hypothetical protein